MLVENCDLFDTQMKNKFNEDLYYIRFFVYTWFYNEIITHKGYDMLITRLDDLFLGSNIAYSLKIHFMINFFPRTHLIYHIKKFGHPT